MEKKNEFLENQCEEEEYKEYMYNEAQKIVREDVSKLIQEREEENTLVWRRYHQRRLIKENTISFICNEKGHKARDCTNRGNFNKVCGREIIREKSDNRNNSNRENDRDERKKVVNKLELLVNEYPEVFKEEDNKVKYLTGIKCKISTKQGEKIIKKGQVVDYYLRDSFKKYLDDLKNRGVIRRSRSVWRNPIRAIKKPNGGIRLLSNLKALNDLVEKIRIVDVD
ncbi:hypothetical protein NGRA_2552 [Nosema granulosis]|uniref:CCHC-type domain-containing protein n=1 Tax=Nosema granulosis TaxID=83296 RepID=A0A9P6GXV1_9MICR|nr:hypothetical protein NGRA_2552 [Nosema granulosis]